MLVCVGLTMVSNSQAADGNVVDDIRRSWSAREQRIKTAVFEWEAVHELPGVSPPGAPDSMSRSPSAASSIKRFESANTLWFDGPKFSHRFEPRDPSDENLSIRNRTAFDGVSSQKLLESKDRRRGASGMVSKNPHEFAMITADARPVLMIYRAMTEHLSDIQFDRLSLVSTQRRIGDVQCIVLRQNGSHGIPISNEYWLDPSRDYLPTQMITFVEQKPRTRIQIDYETDSEYGWVPAKWKLTQTNEIGDLVVSIKATVIQYEINTPVDPNEFQITFPKGTLVEDRRRGGEGVPVRREIIQSAVPAAQIGQPVERLSSWWYLAAAGAAALVLAGWLAYRRRKTT